MKFLKEGCKSANKVLNIFFSTFAMVRSGQLLTQNEVRPKTTLIRPIGVAYGVNRDPSTDSGRVNCCLSLQIGTISTVWKIEIMSRLVSGESVHSAIKSLRRLLV